MEPAIGILAAQIQICLARELLRGPQMFSSDITGGVFIWQSSVWGGGRGKVEDATDDFVSYY